MTDMHLRIRDNGSVQFPYNLRDLAADFPRTSFPAVDLLTAETLASFKVYPCTITNARDVDTDSSSAVIGNPKQAADGTWSAAWRLVADSQDLLLMKLAALTDRVKARIEDDYLAGINTLNGGADSYEMMTWPVQLTEANRIQNNPTANNVPIITALAAFKGVTKAEYAATVVSNAQEYNAAYALLLGAKKAKMRQVRNIINGADTTEAKIAALRAI